MLDNYRSTLNWWLVPLAKALRSIHPDVFTWFALAMALAGGGLFWASGPDPAGLALMMLAIVLMTICSVGWLRRSPGWTRPTAPTPIR